MNPSERDTSSLPDLISLLWRHGQRAATRRPAPDTARAPSPEAAHLLADNPQTPRRERVVRSDHRLPGASSTDQGVQQ
jgi:hypothetical protein